MTVHSTIGHSFLASGTPAIDTAYAMDRRLAEAESRRLVANARNAESPTGLRHAIGSLLISFGAFIAGTTTHIQDRQATMPAPAPKPGFVPTR
jgi:hypothetical protein